MMHGRPGGMLNQETLKPRALGETLARLGRYFSQYWYMIALAVLFVVIATWTQVTTPELTGQATDCFLVPAGASAFGSENGSQQPPSTCYLNTDDPSALTISRRIVYNLYTLGGFEMADPSTATNAQRIGGLFRLVLVMIALFVLGSVLTGATFFTMAWTGQHVLRVLRVRVFEQLHRLSLSYYSEHEAGDLMSRITNDTTAIEQAFSFALVNVFSGILLLVWVAYNMVITNAPFALLSLSVAPVMFIATWYFSEQARKAFRVSREEIGNVNAELQESI
ncbi:MAG TPA: ABC transporter transmembrane domain-containing protein, partial [Anaerolineales bacterium]|nr:ABC transporter transmembrane domain-containing protein [Anaerolineales bacterium]